MDINPVNKLGFFERLSSMLLRKPEDREQLMELLHSAYERNLLDADALSITEGALAASEISVSDVMVPRSQMEVIDIRAKSLPRSIAPHTRAFQSSMEIATTS